MKTFVFRFCIFCLLACLLSGCVMIPDPNTPEAKANAVDQLIEGMTLDEKIFQMFFVTPEDICDVGTVVQAGEATQTALKQYPVGGIIYFSKNIENREQLMAMLKNVTAYSKIPPFLSIDEEGGRVSRLGDANVGITHHPPMAEISKTGDREKALEVGITLGKELTELGFTMDFAPVADVLTVGKNEDIGDRSFGTDPHLVADMVAAQVEGMQSQNLSATLKHFPGNGSTEANTHLGMGVSYRTLEELRQVEFLPFRAGIDAGADMVMVAHISLPNVTNSQIPATLSPLVVTDLLRKELGFEKVIITDALNMGAITDHYTPEEAAVLAVEAGADMLLMSPDIDADFWAIKEAVETGKISENRIEESVRRILTLKQERGNLY